MNPSAQIIGWRLASVFEVYLRFWNGWLRKLQEGGVHTDIGAHLPNLSLFHSLNLTSHGFSGVFHLAQLPFHQVSLSLNGFQRDDGNEDSGNSRDEQSDIREIFGRKQALEVPLRVSLGLIAFCLGCILNYRSRGLLVGSLGALLICIGLGAFFLPVYWDHDATHGCSKRCQREEPHDINVTQKYLDSQAGRAYSWPMDTFLTILFWIIQGGMAALGAYVSLRPQPAQRHTKLIVSFVVLFVLGGAINIIQTQRASNAQGQLQSQLAAIQKNTQNPPKV